MTAYTVVWNGAKDHPGGAYLFAQPHPVKPAPSLVAEVSDVDAVRGTRDHFRDQWFTASEMAQKAGLSSDKTNSAIWSILRYGEIVREREKTRQVRQRYRFVP